MSEIISKKIGKNNRAPKMKRMLLNLVFINFKFINRNKDKKANPIH